MGASRTTPAPGRAGVSLLVMLLTLTFMAIVAGLAIPAFFNQHRVTLDNAARLLARDLHTAQNMASFDARALVFEFLDEGRGWRLVGPDGSVVDRPDQAGTFERDLAKDGVFEGVRLEHVDFAGARRLYFDKTGRALPGGTLHVTFEDEHRIVRVFPLSGRVIIDGIADEYAEAWR